MQKLIQKLDPLLNSKLLPVFIILLESILLVCLCYKKESLSDVGLYLKYSELNPSFDYSTVKQFDRWTNEQEFLDAISSLSSVPGSTDTVPELDTKENEMYSFGSLPYQTSFTKYFYKLLYSSNISSSINPKWILFSFNLIFFILLELILYYFVLYLTHLPSVSIITMIIIGEAFYTLSSVLNAPPTFMPSAVFSLMYMFLHVVMLDELDSIKGQKSLDLKKFKVFAVQCILMLTLLLISQYFIDAGLILLAITISMIYLIYSVFKHRFYFLSYTLVFLSGIYLLLILYKDFSLQMIKEYFALKNYEYLFNSFSTIKYYILDNYYTHFFTNLTLIYIAYKVIEKICSIRIDQTSKDIQLTIIKPTFSMYKISWNTKLIRYVVFLIIGFIACTYISLPYNQPDDTYCVNYIILGSLFFIILSCFIKFRSGIIVYFLAFLFVSVLSLRTDKMFVSCKVKYPPTADPKKVYIYVPNLMDKISKTHLLDFIKYVPKGASVYFSTKADNIVEGIKKDTRQDQRAYLLTTNSSDIDFKTPGCLKMVHHFSSVNATADSYSLYLVTYTKNKAIVDEKK